VGDDDEDDLSSLPTTTDGGIFWVNFLFKGITGEKKLEATRDLLISG